MAQFQVADVPGQVQRGQQFAINNQITAEKLSQSQFAGKQQQKLAPIQQQQAQANLESTQFSTTQAQEEGVYKRNVFSAMELNDIPDNRKAEFLTNKISSADPSRDMTQSKKALELVNAGKFDELNQGAKSLIDQATRQGLIKPLAGTQTKPTASAQDFNTWKELKAKAEKTGDQVDIDLFNAFGVQSGFDRLSPQELADIDVNKESRKTLGKQAATASKEAFDSLKNVRRTIANMDDAIKALDNNAETGPIISKLPSFRQASIELDNIKGRMGLDVISSVTFGALSESELKFALDTALPTKLEPKALREWLVEKKRVQGLLANELRSAASFLGTPGNTIADYIEKQEVEAEKTKTDEDKIFSKYGI